VKAANTLFVAVSNILPGEPYLYSSRAGNLVAEFENKVGRMTLIVSGDAALALASVGQERIEKRFELAGATPERLRNELTGIADRLRKHDSVGT
jgi:hypothetical protein